MVSPIGEEYCTPATQRIIVQSVESCYETIGEELQNLYQSNLEEFRPHLPALSEGKLKLKWSCATPIHESWVGKEFPTYKE